MDGSVYVQKIPSNYDEQVVSLINNAEEPHKTQIETVWETLKDNK